MKVKAMRVNVDLSQEDVARKLNLSRVAYAAKEDGKSEFKLSELKTLAKLFKVKFSEFEKI